MNPSFDTAFCIILNAVGDICERICCHTVLYMWPIMFCDLIGDSVCVVDTMIL